MTNKIVKDSLETIEGIAKGVADDAKQSLTGQYPSPKPQATISNDQKSDIKKQEAQQAQQIRQNIARIDQQIIEARKKREQKNQQQVRQEVQKKQEKKFEVKKKESVLEKLIKSQKGTKEGVQRASG